MISTILFALLTVRPLTPGSAIQDSLAAGEKAIFSIDVPAQTAARVVIRQEGIDVDVTLRRAGSDLPEHGINMTAGPAGAELLFPPISDAPATWNVFVESVLPRAERGNYTISLQTAPADDHARAIADARQQYQAASDTSWGGDGPSFRKAEAMYMAAGEAALAAGDKDLAAESFYQGARNIDNLGDYLRAIERQRRALDLFREVGRRDREARALNRLGDLSRKIGEITDSERYFQEALPIAREAKDPVNVADIMNNSGLLMQSLGRFEEALERLEAAVPLAQEVGSANVETALWSNIAESYRRMGVYEKSIEGHLRAVELSRRNLPVRRVARNLHSLALVFNWKSRRNCSKHAPATFFYL